MSTMTRRDTVAWAKEVILEAIDEKIVEIAGDDDRQRHRPRRGLDDAMDEGV